MLLSMVPYAAEWASLPSQRGPCIRGFRGAVSNPPSSCPARVRTVEVPHRLDDVYRFQTEQIQTEQNNVANPCRKSVCWCVSKLANS
jgi:hypothetical protein